MDFEKYVLKSFMKIDDLRETIEFSNTPEDIDILNDLRLHFMAMAKLAMAKDRNEFDGALEDEELYFSGELTITGEKNYTTNDVEEFYKGIETDIPNSKGFKIKISYYGPDPAQYFNIDGDVSYINAKYLEEVSKVAKFNYTVFKAYSSGDNYFGRFENGNWVDIDNVSTADILDVDYGTEWWTMYLTLSVEFDYGKHSDILAALRECVRKYTNDFDYENSECMWDEEPNLLAYNVILMPTKLRVVQDFLDEFNDILAPIKDECVCTSFDSSWYMLGDRLGCAKCFWTDEGFKVKGIVY